MSSQAARFGLAELTHAAQTVNHALTEMSGATSPKLHLELMCAKVLVPSSDQTEIGSLARIERLERRIGVGGDSAPAPVETKSPAANAAPAASKSPVTNPTPAASQAPSASQATVASQTPASAPIGAVTLNQVRDAWSDVLSKVNKQSKSAWMVAFSLTVVDFADEILTLKFLSQNDLDAFKNASGASDILRKAIFDVLGVQVKFKAQIEAVAASPAAAQAAPASTPTTVVAQVATAPEPEDYEPGPEGVAAEDDEPVLRAEPPKAETPTKSRNTMVDESARYGESLLREMLGAEPIIDKNAGK